MFARSLSLCLGALLSYRTHLPERVQRLPATAALRRSSGGLELGLALWSALLLFTSVFKGLYLYIYCGILMLMFWRAVSFVGSFISLCRSPLCVRSGSSTAPSALRRVPLFPLGLSADSLLLVPPKEPSPAGEPHPDAPRALAPRRAHPVRCAGASRSLPCRYSFVWGDGDSVPGFCFVRPAASESVCWEEFWLSS